MLKVFFIVFAYACLNQARGAKILGVFQTPSISHQVVFQPIWRELSLRGHDVMVLTPDPLNDPHLTNLTEIDLGFSYEILRKGNMQVTLNKDLPFTAVVRFAFDIFAEVAEAQLTHPEVQALIKDKTRHFDVMLVEFLYPAMYALSARFSCPMIGITSLETLIHGYDAVGNPSHPALNPDIMLPIMDNSLGFYDRIRSTLYAVWERYYYRYHSLPKADEIVRKYISEDLPYIGDIERNVSMLFVNVNPITHRIRPNVPAVIELGRMHITKTKPLPSDLQKEADKATQGVIYFSLGSNVRSASLSEQLKKTIIDSFSELPYTFLWKWETDYLPGQPKNVIIRKWFPQQDVLGHPNVKAFVTQGGLQSMEEAISNGVPLIGMPFFADQPLNVMNMVHLGIAQSVDPTTVTKEQLKAAIIEVAENSKYRNKIEEIGRLISDVPMSGLDKAVWWTEYVIRHKGARHLRSPAADMPWYQYLLLDVLSFVLTVTLLAVYVIWKVVSLFFEVIRKYTAYSKAKTN